jgi:hypothetical protein
VTSKLSGHMHKANHLAIKNFPEGGLNQPHLPPVVNRVKYNVYFLHNHEMTTMLFVLASGKKE